MCDNVIDPIADFSQNKLAVFLTISFILYYYQKFVKIILQVLLGCTIDEDKSLSDVIFLMLEFCITKNSSFIFDIYIPSKIISFSGSIITAIDELIDGFSVKIVLPSISMHVTLMLFLFLFFGIHFYFFCYFFINYKKNIEVNSLIFNNLFTILYYTIGAAIYHTLFIFDRSNFGCSIQTEHKVNTIRNYGELIYHFIDFAINITRICIIGPSLYTSFHVFLSFGKLYNSYDDFIFYLKVKNIKSELPDATIQDLERDDTCIICRESMTAGTAKKLPCGHCFHTTCLERWVNKNPACPTCSRDLRKILKKSNSDKEDKKNEEQENENEQNNDNNGQNNENEIDGINNNQNNENEIDGINNNQNNENEIDDINNDQNNENEIDDVNNENNVNEIDDINNNQNNENEIDDINNENNENEIDDINNDQNNENEIDDINNENNDIENDHNDTNNENNNEIHDGNINFEYYSNNDNENEDENNDDKKNNANNNNDN